MLTGIELIHAANPLQPARGQIVEGDEVVVSGHAVDGPDADLVQPPEQVLGDVDGLLEVLDPDVCHGEDAQIFFCDKGEGGGEDEDEDGT